MPAPPPQKPYPQGEGATLFGLVAPELPVTGHTSVIEAIRQRRSGHEFTDEPLIAEELSFLLWPTQGIDRVLQA